MSVETKTGVEGVVAAVTCLTRVDGWRDADLSRGNSCGVGPHYIWR
jgi:hypothetical protein